jgi:predicted Fe-S protein YdhL (DUF1289 family)
MAEISRWAQMSGAERTRVMAGLGARLETLRRAHNQT